MYIPTPIVGYICDKNKKYKKQKLRGLTVCHSPARKAPKPTHCFLSTSRNRFSVCFIYHVRAPQWTSEKEQGELQPLHLIHNQNSMLVLWQQFFSGKLGRHNFTSSRCTKSRHSGARKSTKVTPSPKQICFQGHGNQRAICYLFVACKLWLSW